MTPTCEQLKEFLLHLKGLGLPLMPNGLDFGLDTISFSAHRILQSKGTLKEFHQVSGYKVVLSLGVMNGEAGRAKR